MDSVLALAQRRVWGHGFPFLSLLGQFLLKGTVLAAAAINLVALDSAGRRMHVRQAGAATGKAAVS